MGVLEVDGKGGFLLRPAEAVLAKLPFVGKMAVVGLLVTLPLLYLAQAYVRDLHRSVSATRQEIRGLEVIRPAVEMVKEVQRHRGTAARFLGGEAGARGELSEFRKRADGKAAEVRALLRERAEFGLSDRWERISSSWQELASGVEGMDPRTSFDAHTRLIEEILSFISEVQDASGLTLDPEVETYHLMVLATDTLPRLTEALGQEWAVGSGAAARGEVTAEERAKLFALFGRAQDGLGRLGFSTKRVFSRVPELRGRLEASARAAEEAVGELQSRVEREFLSGQKPGVSSKEFFDLATRAIDGVYDSWEEMEKALGELLSARAARERFRMVLAFMLVAGFFLLTFYLLLALALSVRRGLALMEEVSRRMAQGDLTSAEVHLGTRDELGRMAETFTGMARSLRRMVARLAESSQKVSSSSRQMAATASQANEALSQISTAVEGMSRGAQDQSAGAKKTAQVVHELREAIGQIARGAQDQARSVAQTSELMRQVAQAVDQVARAAQEVALAAGEALRRAEEGGEAIRGMVEGMERIRETSRLAAEKVRELGASSRRIGEIVQVISEIADQTNLLALNAAIEAARAGEHGRGFAVVAEEVRKLAERSGQATRDIAELIGGMQKEVEAVVEAIGAGAREVEQGVGLAGEAGKALDGILQAMRRTNEEVQSISAASEEAAAGAGEAVKAAGDTASVTEENTAAAQEMAASSEEVLRAVEEVARISEETASRIQEVSASTEEVGASARDIARVSRELGEMARELEEMVSSFKV